MNGRNTGDPPDGSRGEEPFLDRVFEVLRDPVRRQILTSLVASSPGEDEALDLAAVDLTSERSEPLAVTLRHTHLPKLEEAGYVDWCRRDGTVEPGPNFDEVAPVVDLLDDHQERLPGGWP